MPRSSLFRRWLGVLSLAMAAWNISAERLTAQQNVLINDDAGSSNQEGPSIAIDSSGTMMVAWADYRAGTPQRPQIFVAVSTDDGFTWSSNRIASSEAAWPTGGMEMGPAIASTGPGAFVIDWADIRRSPSWSMVDVSVAHTTDGGMSFSEISRINSETPKSQHQPSVAAGGDGTVYTVWHSFPRLAENPATPVFVARSTDRGASFEAQRRIDLYDSAATARKVGSCNCCGPSIFTDGGTVQGTVYTAFRIDSASYRDIFLARSSDGGATWGTSVRVSKGMWRFNACPGTGPRGFARNDTVWITWMDNRANAEFPSVWLARSTDGGASFGPDVLVDDRGSFPALAVDPRGRVFVAWSAQEKGGTLCAVSEDGGLTFSRKRAVDMGQDEHINTEVACSPAPNGNIYSVWRDQSSDDGDIRFTNLTELMYSSSGVEAGENTDITGPFVSVSPNPGNPGGDLLVSISKPARSIVVIDPIGRIVERLDPASSSQRVRIEESGMYFVIADFGSIRRTEPVVVAR